MTGQAWFAATRERWKDRDGYEEACSLQALVLLRNDGHADVLEWLEADDRDTTLWLALHPDAPASAGVGSEARRIAAAWLANPAAQRATTVGRWRGEGEVVVLDLQHTDARQDEYATGTREGWGSPVTHALIPAGRWELVRDGDALRGRGVTFLPVEVDSGA